MAEARLCPECGAELPADAPQGLCPQCLLLRGLGDDSGPSQDLADDRTLPPRNIKMNGTAPGTQVRYFGDYEILEEISRGGMGVVYKARQVSLDRIVALKMILAGHLASESDVERFYIEARAAANLQHPNIVAIHEVGQHEGRHYFSMDYVEGRSLASLVDAGPLTASKAAAYLKTIAEAIHYAHQHGILHRDLKPSNILIDSFDQPRVTDFGIAKRLGARDVPSAVATGPVTPPSLTAAGQVLGTPSYMPPEQVDGDPARIGPASDVYSLGAVLYELLTGRPPFRANSLRDTLLQVIQSEPLPPRRLNRRVPPELERICLTCLRKEPNQRYASASALAEDLERFLLGQPIRAKADLKGRIFRIALACGVMVLLCCGGPLLLAPKLIRWGLNQHEHEAAIQEQFLALAASWQPPTDRDKSRDLLPKRLGDFTLIEQSDNAFIPELGIEVPGRRARYESQRGTVDLFAYQMTGRDCETLLRRVENAFSDKHETTSYRVGPVDSRSGGTRIMRYSYAIRKPKQKGTFLWCADWLLLARTTQDCEPDDLLKAYLEDGRRK
jgi:serine/threonine protein kinase